MKRSGIVRHFVLSAFVFAGTSVSAQQVETTPTPREWVDRDTGHRVVRISDEPGSSSLYFNYNSFTPQGDKLLISTPKGISAYDLKTRKLAPVIAIATPFRLLFVGRKTRSVYYQSVGTAGDRSGPKSVFAVDIDTGKSRKIADVAEGDIQTINADETLLGGVATDPAATATVLGTFAKRDARFDQADYRANWPDGRAMNYAESKEVRMNERLESAIPMTMFVIDTRTGQRRVVRRATDWLNHLQFSPTDPNVLMFCHEGPWHKVDRLWLMRVDRPDEAALKLHTRTMNMEIAGHEWFSRDGKTIWYDLQTPRGEDFWVAGYDIASGRRTQYHLQRNEWSVHFNSSPDGKLFSGDGGDSEMVAHAPDGKYMYLFTPHGIPDVAGLKAPNSDGLIHPGFFTSEKLVNMAKQDYRLEPNGIFTPDGKWLIYRGNMSGATQVYAVEIAKAKP
jgi:oligogalacturonide lyase